MARNVNVQITGVTTGTNVSFPRRVIGLALTWTNADGSPGSWSGNVTFPTILAQLTPEDLQEVVIEVVLRAVRRVQNVDTRLGGGQS